MWGWKKKSFGIGFIGKTQSHFAYGIKKLTTVNTHCARLWTHLLFITEAIRNPISIRHTSLLSSHFYILKIGVYFPSSIPISSKSSFNSFFIPSNVIFVLRITLLFCSILLWKSNLERLNTALGVVVLIGFERKCLV